MAKVRLLIDNNVFHKVVYKDYQDEERALTYRRNFQIFMKDRIRGDHITMATSHSFLEGIGLSLKALGLPIIEKPPREWRPDKQLEAVLNQVEEHYESHPLLKEAALVEAFEQRKKHVCECELSQLLFEDCIARIANSDSFFRTVRDYVMLDAIQQPSFYHDLPEVSGQIIHTCLCKRFENTDVSTYRAAERQFERVVEETKRDPNITAEGRDMLKKSNLSYLKTKGDGLDSEIVYFSVMGLRESGHHRVFAITSDPDVNEIETRIWRAKGAYEISLDRLKNKAPQYFLPRVNGRVYFLDQTTGEFRTVLKVSRVENWGV